MKEYESTYLRWKTQAALNSEVREALEKIEDNIAEIEDRFYKNLEFGTGGMRGIIGYGSNRMNIFTVRRASMALAEFLRQNKSGKELKAVIAFDSRHKSPEFALESALVLAKSGIRTYIFTDITPTPVLSYAVKELQADAGIVITASHNPKEYNGYKVYTDYGGQITDDDAFSIIDKYNNISDEFSIASLSRQEAEKSGLLVWIGDNLLEKYLAKNLELIFDQDLVSSRGSNLKIVYTPLHGTGLLPITRLFEKAGFTNVSTVTEQCTADPDFSTLVCPNPEEIEACKMAVDVGKTVDADIILATDPDADRVGLVVKDEQGRYMHLTGNQTGALMIDYILRARQKKGTIPADGRIIKTIVTSNMGVDIAAGYGVKYIDVLTGFKYIGEKIAEFEKTKEHTFLFGYEESYGYLIGDFVRDKDAVQACLCIAEMALYYKEQGKTPYQRLQELFNELGYYREDLINISLTGMEGQMRIQRIMDSLRENVPHQIGGYSVESYRDYLTGLETDLAIGSQEQLTLPFSNVMYFSLEEDSWCCVRPSGTEPKLKIYIAVKGSSEEDSEIRVKTIRQALLKIVEAIS